MTATSQGSTEDVEPREDALPKWVRDKLQLMRVNLADERKRNAELRGDVGETDTLIRYYEGRPDTLLPPRSEVSFLPDLAYPHREITCRMRDGQLLVHGERGLIVMPRMSNDITVQLEA
ncbi:DUF7239 family protein [Streptomyces mirabilis]|uniref:DUF7239 family protein n=1 Tax=Streptomyces mirabilis TaxID=68239 RepID=UPI00368B765B